MKYIIHNHNEGDLNGLLKATNYKYEWAVASSTYPFGYSTQGPIDGSSIAWASDYEGNQSYTVIFNGLIYTEHYTMQTTNWDENTEHPKSWNLYGIYHNNMTLISEITDSGLNSPNAVKTYPTSKLGPFTSLHFLSTGKTYATAQNKEQRFVIAHLEFFGTFTPFITCDIKNSNNLIHITIFIFISMT